MDIRKEDFAAYVKIQMAGKFNMITESRKAAHAAGLSLGQYMIILENYEHFSKLYPEVVS